MNHLKRKYSFEDLINQNFERRNIHLEVTFFKTEVAE